MTRWTEEMKTLAVGMKRAGMSNKAIAARLGTTPKAVGSMTAKLKARRRLDGKGGQVNQFKHATGRVVRELFSVENREEWLDDQT